MKWHHPIVAGGALLVSAASTALPSIGTATEVRLTCHRTSGGESDPRWVADRRKFGIAQPIVDDDGDLAFDPAGPTLTLFETGDRRHVLRAQRVGTRYVTRQLTGANRVGSLGGHVISIVRDYEPATRRLRVYLEARSGEDRWAYVEYACSPVVTDEDDADPPDWADDALDND